MTDVLKDVTRDQLLADSEILADDALELMACKGSDLPSKAPTYQRAAALLRGLVMLHDMGEQTPQDRRGWICRESTTGRGLRLHQTSSAEAWDCQRYDTPWAALPSAGE